MYIIVGLEIDSKDSILALMNLFIASAPRVQTTATGVKSTAMRVKTTATGVKTTAIWSKF